MDIKAPQSQQAYSDFIRRLIKRTRISEKDKSEFCTQLAVMLQAGVSVHRSLQVLSQQTKNEKMNGIITSLSKDIQGGNSFAKALSRHPDIFDTLFVITAEVGQESGKLPEVLAQLSMHIEKINALKKKFLQALIYPALVLTVAVAAVLFLLMFIVPAFAEMFKTFQIELPFTTQLVLGLSNAVMTYGIYALISLIVASVIFRGILISPDTKKKIERWSLRIPVMGDVILKNHVARFCRTLGTLLHAQVSLVDALNVTQRIFTNEDVRNEIGLIVRSVKQGQAVADQLVESKLFPPMVAQMITVGEETSELDLMLLKVADYYEKEIDSKVETLSSVIEPVIILFLGLLVSLILISMYMPMFDLVSVVGGG
jgi:type IV pilus assembly protein PilC